MQNSKSCCFIYTKLTSSKRPAASVTFTCTSTVSVVAVVMALTNCSVACSPIEGRNAKRVSVLGSTDQVMRSPSASAALSVIMSLLTRQLVSAAGV